MTFPHSQVPKGVVSPKGGFGGCPPNLGAKLRILPPKSETQTQLQELLGLAAQCEIPPPYRAIPFRDSIAEGGIATICLLFMWYRASIAEMLLLWGGGSHLHFACSRGIAQYGTTKLLGKPIQSKSGRRTFGQGVWNPG